jgi:hypothetical protein
MKRVFENAKITLILFTALHTKLTKSWQEVPQNMHNQLKEKLLQKIIEFGGAGTKLVLNRLSMCVSIHLMK